MSSSTNSPPPDTPADPSPPVSPIKLALPKPPSFFAHRNRAVGADGDGDGDDAPPEPSPRSHVAFDLAGGKARGHALDLDGARAGAYRIPQRSPGFRPPSAGSTDGQAGAAGAAGEAGPARTGRAPPPRALSLAKPSPLNPGAAAPMTAPATRMASAAAARGISIAPALARGARSSLPGLDKGSIWSAGPGVAGAGWITPGLGTGKSVGPSGELKSARPRGLTVAVLKEGGGKLAESAPMTPGLGSAALKSATVALASAPLKSAALRSAALSTGRLDGARKEIILCRYYHTPGLTCTSRPCRFVHALETLGKAAPASLSAYPMLSPRPENGAAPDPTMGTFAQAQARAAAAQAGASGLVLGDVDLTQIAPGEAVAVIDEATGDEVVGHVFMMSGGGKGPAGKSKAKFKTVPCKDFADGYCPYGDYCSFIHDWDNMYDAAVHGPDAAKSPVPASPAPSAAPSAAGTHRRGSSLSAWAEQLPQTIKVAAMTFDAGALAKNAPAAGGRLSAFAAPFSEQLDSAGQVVALPSPRMPPAARYADVVSPRARDEGAMPAPLLVPIAEDAVVDAVGDSVAVVEVPAVVAVPVIAEPPRPGAWAKGPPAGLGLRRVTLAVPAEPATPATAGLVPPSATFTLFGTESDPATPWDPALQADRLRDAEAAAESAPPVPAIVDSTLAPAYPSPGAAPWAAPMYPWGMPMSPVGAGADAKAPAVTGGLGVMWTPAGWAVQDAAMKHALRSAEVQLAHPDARRRKPKSYYRTKPCRFFADGFCPHGDSCTYAHTDAGGPGGSEGEDGAAPRARRTIPCKFFNSALGCVNGDECNFLHTRVVPDSAPLVARPRPWRTRPCRHFQTGTCALGDACHFAHVVDATYRESAPCQAWAKTGRCDKGGKCRFRHVGEGGEANAEGLTEERLAAALEEIKRSAPQSARDDDDDDDDDDDVEIVTVESRTMSPTRSVSVAA